MKIKCDKNNFFKIYNEMQGVGLNVSKLKDGKTVKTHHYTYYIIMYFIFALLFGILFLFFKKYYVFTILLQVLLFLFLFIALAMSFIYFIGYYSMKKRLGGEVELKIEGVEDREKDGLIFFAPWSLIDFVYLGKYGTYFFVRKRIVIFGDNSKQKEIRKYLEENKIDVFVYNIDN